jgi:hypothetical protein
VLIVVQLDRSDHYNLGKIVTNLVAVDASTAIWI